MQLRVSLTFRCVQHSWVHKELGYFVGPNGNREQLQGGAERLQRDVTGDTGSDTRALQHASTGRLDAAAVEGNASLLAIGPSDTPGQQQALVGVDGVHMVDESMQELTQAAQGEAPIGGDYSTCELVKEEAVERD